MNPFTVYYRDGTTWTQEDGPVETAPRWNVWAVNYFSSRGNNLVHLIDNFMYFYMRDLKEWIGANAELALQMTSGCMPLTDMVLFSSGPRPSQVCGNDPARPDYVPSWAEPLDG